MSRSTPISLNLASAPKSVVTPSMGVWSSLKSPVCRTLPAGLWKNTPTAPGMEWFTAKNSAVKHPKLHLVARLDLHQLGVLDAVLGQLALDEAERELGRVDGHLAVEVLQQVRQRARVVLMPMRDDDAAQLVGVFQHVGVVGQDEVDARMVVVGEHEPSVVQDHVALAFEDGHVLADGVEAAQRDDLQRGGRVLLRRGEVAPGVLLAAAFAAQRLAFLGEFRALALQLHVLVGLRPLVRTVRPRRLARARSAAVVLFFHSFPLRHVHGRAGSGPP